MTEQSKAVVPYLRTFSNEEKSLLAALVKQVVPQATNDEKAMFLYTAQKKGLDPFTKQIYLVPRWDSKQSKNVHSVQVSIDGLRLMAQRSGKYAGQTPYEWCGKDGKWVDVWVDDATMPVAARVGIYRHDFKEPLYSVARFNDYKQTKKDGSLNTFWQKYGPHMIAKCCEALSIRRAFPEETSGFYIAEEMGNAELVYSVEETAQDTSAPIVGELVEDAPPVAGNGATSNRAQEAKNGDRESNIERTTSRDTGTNVITNTKTQTAQENKNVPSIRELQARCSQICGAGQWQALLGKVLKIPTPVKDSALLPDDLLKVATYLEKVEAMKTTGK